jgi:hypothetical protein
MYFNADDKNLHSDLSEVGIFILSDHHGKERRENVGQWCPLITVSLKVIRTSTSSILSVSSSCYKNRVKFTKLNETGSPV